MTNRKLKIHIQVTYETVPSWVYENMKAEYVTKHWTFLKKKKELQAKSASKAAKRSIDPMKHTCRSASEAAERGFDDTWGTIAALD